MARDKKRHLSLQLSQKGAFEKNTESTGRMNELVLTSIMNNMNITYKMPYMSTKLYSYIYSMYVQRGIRKSKWGLRKNEKGELLDSSLLELFTGGGSNFTQDKIISLAKTQ